MYQFKRILKMDFMNLFTNPMWWIGTIGLPLLLILALGFITQGSYSTTVTSYDYYTIAILVFGLLNNATLAANSFMEERIKNANMRLCYAPIKPFYMYFSKIVASFLFGLICHAIVIGIVVIAFQVNLGSHYIELVLLLLGVEFFASCLGILFCCIFKTEEIVNQLLSTIISILCVISGTFFPIKGIHPIIDTLSQISPVTWIYEAIFTLIYDQQIQLTIYVVLGLTLASLMIIGLCTKLFRQEDYL